MTLTCVTVQIITMVSYIHEHVLNCHQFFVTSMSSCISIDLYIHK